jgi:tetratricopeptide (TPR) repeat protein
VEIHRLSRATVALSLILFVAALAASGCDAINPWSPYHKAVAAFDLNDFETAFKLLETIPDHKDPKDIRKQVTYHYAIYLSNVKRYQEAVELFERYPNFRDCVDRLRSTHLAWADKLTALGEHAQALEIYRKLGEEGRMAEALMKKAASLIGQGQYEQAIAEIKDLPEGPDVQDLLRAAHKGQLYAQGAAAVKANSLKDAREKFDEAVKIQTDTVVVEEDDALVLYCGALKPLVTRLGAEGKYEEVLRAVFPVHHKIQLQDNADCEDVLKLVAEVQNRYFFDIAGHSDWHQQIGSYAEKFKDPSTRCNVYGGIILQHLKRQKGQVLANPMLAAERIGTECDQVPAAIWDEAKGSLELALSKMALEWKKKKNYMKLLRLQKYVSTRLEKLNLELGQWDQVSEAELIPESKLAATSISSTLYVISGMVTNPSSYKPLNVTGIFVDCKPVESDQILTKCSSVKLKQQVLPGARHTITTQLKVPSGTEEIVGIRLKTAFADVDISDISLKDLFKPDEK